MGTKYPVMLQFPVMMTTGDAAVPFTGCHGYGGNRHYAFDTTVAKLVCFPFLLIGTKGGELTRGGPDTRSHVQALARQVGMTLISGRIYFSCLSCFVFLPLVV